MPGTTTFAGTTNVNGGTLQVDGDIRASLLANVAAGATLSGVGILPQTNVDGFVSPGVGGIGTLTVQGDLNMRAGSIYQLDIGPSGVSDLINVNGAANLSGSGVNIVTPHPVFAGGSRYTILTASGGVNGAFDNPVQRLPLVDLSLSYDPNNVYFNVTPNGSTVTTVISQPQPGQATQPSGTQLSTATAVQALGPNSPVLGAVSVQPTIGAITAALDQLSGQTYASLRSSFIDDSVFVRDAVDDRIRTAFAGRSPASGEAVPEERVAGRGSVWTHGFGSWTNRASTDYAAALDGSIAGLFVGGDVILGNSFALGALGGYSRSSFSIPNRNSSGRSDNYTLGLYAGGSFGRWNLTGGAAHTWHSISVDRAVIFPAFSDMLAAAYSAGTTQVFGDVGYEAQFGRFAIEPFVGAAWVNLSTAGFTERGGAAALSVAGANDSIGLTTVGLRAAVNFDLSDASHLTLRGMVGWRHAFGNLLPADSVAFVGAAPFSVTGLPISQDAAIVELGMDFKVTKATTLGISYRGQFGAGAMSNGVNGLFSVRF
ncbi:MAG: autotransporter domain-containing protein [Rhizobiaceae bacterium]|nr:autotransporter domain-containing protein [Rhizobiaceae bacterium]